MVWRVAGCSNLFYEKPPSVSELQKFLFDGIPVRGAIVRLTDAWQDILCRRAANTATGPYPAPVRELLGEMAAAGVLMQANIKFNGALILQIAGDGPVRLAVAEVQSNLALRATATLRGDVPATASLAQLVNTSGHGRCAITLDPRNRLPGQQPYQGIAPLGGLDGQPLDKLSQAIEHYMLRSEQLDTTLVLAANDTVAAGLLLQRMPAKGAANLSGATESARDEHDALGASEDYHRLATLAASLTREELLALDADTILRRLFWQERLLQLLPLDDAAEGATHEAAHDAGQYDAVPQPHFACTCSRERVQGMLRSLGQPEVDSVIAERGHVEVGCDYCGAQYCFDAVDAAQLFASPGQPPGPATVQ